MMKAYKVYTAWEDHFFIWIGDDEEIENELDILAWEYDLEPEDFTGYEYVGEVELD